jgi:ubiquinone biosynthesis accessory factor UbiJ
MTIAAKSFVAVVNHLLVREAWARERLVPYAGKTARLVLPPFELALAVQGDGSIVALERADTPDQADAAHHQAVDVTITVPPAALSAFATGGQAASMKHVRIEGDAEFAATIAKLAEHLRWEPEEDLSRVIGDAPAHRIASVARGVAGYAQRTGRHLAESVAEYLLDEDPQLVRRAELAPFADEVARTRDALARLEKRIERAEQKAARLRPPTHRPDAPSADDSH